MGQGCGRSVVEGMGANVYGERAESRLTVGSRHGREHRSSLPPTQERARIRDEVALDASRPDHP